jgi:hypothetical protein
VISCRRLCLLAAVAVALLAPGCALGKSHKAGDKPQPALASAPWNPLKDQGVDAATTFFFNPAVARTQAPGNGGFLMGNNPAGDVPWRPTSKVAVVPGRFHLGVRSTDYRYGYLWMPSSGILSPTAFTIEFWVQSSTPYSAVNGVPVSVSGVVFSFSNGFLSAKFGNNQRYPPVQTALSTSVRSLPAKAWENIALTYSRGRLVLYVNGARAASRSGVAAPQVWSDTSRSSGLTVAGAFGKGATQLTVSDLRISRIARVPRKRSGNLASTLTVTTSAARREHIRQSLLGGLHSLTSSRTDRMARGVVRVIRTDKLINGTPIKAGPPDAAHPSRGFTGGYSYNWAVVDRTMRYLKSLKVAPYLSIDSTPQLLGGREPSLSRPLLSTARSFQAAFNPQVPNDLHAWKLIVEDLAFHILKQDHVPVAYWGVWNEPDGGHFWLGTLDQYLALYQATVSGVRTVDPKATVGGADTVGFNLQWVSALMGFCASHHVPLDFVSWHYYTGNLGAIPAARATVAALAAQNRMKRPFLNIGEWSWQLANRPQSGALPFRNYNYFLNDWSAGFVGASLIEMQGNDVATSIYDKPVATANEVAHPHPPVAGFSSGLMSPTEPWANFNVYLLWHQLPNQVVRTKLNADPGIFAIASKNRHRLAALVVSLHYQLGGRFPLTLRFPRSLAGKRVRISLIDRNHADAYDAGSQHARLHPTSQLLSKRAQLKLSLRARSVVLVQAPLR